MPEAAPQRKVWPRLVPYQQPPENLASDQRAQLLWLFEREIRDAMGRATVEQLAKRLLTRLDLQGWTPGARQASRPAIPRRGICRTHLEQLPCRCCAADRKAAPE